MSAIYRSETAKIATARGIRWAQKSEREVLR